VIQNIRAFLVLQNNGDTVKNYQNSPLSIAAKLPDGSTTSGIVLDSKNEILGGTPTAVFPLNDFEPSSSDQSILTLSVDESSVKALDKEFRESVPASGPSPHQRLKAALINDIFVVCEYTVS
jgi:hypothetical protein